MLFKEVSKGIGTKCVPASDEEVEKAKKQYKETKKCDHRFIYDEAGNLYNADGIALEDLNFHTFFYADNEIESCLNLIEIGYDAEISR